MNVDRVLGVYSRTRK